MCDAEKNQQKLTDKRVIGFFVQYLADQGHPGIEVDAWPDEELPSEIDAIAGPFAIEHTSVDTIPNQRRDGAWFVRVVKPLEDEFRSGLPFRLVLTLPYEGIQTGQDWSRITTALRNWILDEAPKLPIGFHAIKGVPEIPFEFYAAKRSSSLTGLLFGRFAPHDQTLPDRLREQLDRKIKKLSPYKVRNKTTILLVESDDIALMNDGIMWEGLRSAYPDGLPQGLDQIWFADTSIPEEILFIDMTQAVVR
ncbi:MAG: hypothetical protein OS130_11160 [Thermodesulfobacteriota bacterium]|jgi:hypothetical protein|nr:MAG: hypothetical protein OS130_11160 [Thermodesulfobacteriota bacterium]